MRQVHARVEVLSESEIVRIHDATLEVLSAVGCHLPHRRVLDRLAAAGAAVDYASAQAKLPPALVEAALQAAGGPRIEGGLKFEAGVLPQSTGASGKRVGISPGNQANIVDYNATARRQGTTEDVLKGLALCNELPYVRRAMPLVTPADCPQVMGDLYGYYLCALYSQKPYTVYTMTPEAARQIMRIAEIAARDGRPSVSYLLEPNGALSYDEISLEMALTFVEAGHGFHVGPMAMAGLDAPVSLAGTLVMQNCYNLIGIVIAHLWNTPCNWSGSAHTMDLRSALCSFGSPNQVLLGWAATQLGNWYGFQVGANCALTDACLPDFQGGFEKGMSAMAMLLAGAGYGAQGIVGADQGASLEQLVIDNEWASALDHILSHGVEVSEETLAVDVIRRVGIRGSFAAEEHTVRHMRETYWRSTIFNYEGWDGWMAKGGKDAYARAHEVVQQILARAYPPPLVVSEAVKRELDELIADAVAHPERFQAQRYQYAAS
jgi:trimethylamine--corrinoid protein Co-methyltransferase